MSVSRRVGRVGAVGLASALAWTALTVPAQAATSYVLMLVFPDGSPQAPTVGPTAQLQGKVRPLVPDQLDFYGRSVVRVASAASLDPEAGDFEVAVRLRLTRGAGNWNVVQKGFWGDPGQWKLSLHKTSSGLRFSCRVKGTSGAVHAYSVPGVVTAGGAWVTAGCKRVGDRVSVIVDGREVGAAAGPIGTVRSAQDLLIASKGLTASDPDQFLGLVDAVSVRS